MNLNLGCGRLPLDGWVNLDIRPGYGVNVVADACRLPFRTSSISAVRAYNLLEHLRDWESCVLEVARVLRPGGRFDARVPNGEDHAPYHVRTFRKGTLNPFRSDYRPLGMDLRFRGAEWASCELRGVQYFEMTDRFAYHIYPFAWHLEKHVLGERAYRIPFGRPRFLKFEFVRNKKRYESA